jgi:hypothetical protein
MRQYVILYRRGSPDRKWGRLTPNVRRNLYDCEEIRGAVAFMRGNPAAEGLAVQLGEETCNIVAFTQEAKAPQAFPFVEAA